MVAVAAFPDRIAALRAQVAAMTEPGADHGVLAFGVGQVDGRLVAGGLAVGGLHEVAGASTTLTDDAAATLFLAGVAARFATASAAPALWATTSFDLYAPGLAQAGLTASRMLLAEAWDDVQLLGLLEDAVRDGSPAVVGEVRRAPPSPPAASSSPPPTRACPFSFFAAGAKPGWSRSPSHRRPPRAGASLARRRRRCPSPAWAGRAGPSTSSASAAARRSPSWSRIAIRRVASLFLP